MRQQEQMNIVVEQSEDEVEIGDLEPVEEESTC